LSGSLAGDHSESLPVKVRVVQIDAEIINGGVFGLESSLETNFISLKSLVLLGEGSDSLVEKGFIVVQSFDLNDSVLKSLSKIITLSLKRGALSSESIQSLL